MTSVLHRRLARIEAELKPPSNSVICLDEPSGSADNAAWSDFRKCLEEAKATTARLIVVRDAYSAWDKEFSEDYGVMVMGPMEAACASLASKPSTEGNKSALDDLIKRVTKSSQLISVVHDPVDFEDAP